MSGSESPIAGYAPRDVVGSSANVSQLPTQHSEGRSLHLMEQSSAAPYHSMSPMISRRAWQIQADEGVAPVHQYRAASSRAEGGAINSEASKDEMIGSVLPARMLDTHDDPPVFPLTRLQQQGGRARAGTLPSSWSNNPVSTTFSSGGEHHGTVAARPMHSIGITPLGRDFTPWINEPKPADPWSGLTSSVPGTPSESNSLSYLSTFLPQTSIAHRNTIGNAARPSSVLLNQFNLSAEESASLSQTSPSLLHANSSSTPFSQAGYNGLRSRSGSTNTSVPGLGASPLGNPLVSSPWAERALGLGASGRNSPASRRGSVLASGSPLGYGETMNAGVNYDSLNVPSRYQADTLAPPDYGATDRGEYDALNISDAHLASTPRSNLAPGNQRTRASTLAAMPHGPLARTRSNQDVASLNEPHRINSSSAHASRSRDPSHDSSSDAAVNAFNAGRLRSGTVAALGGPGGRQRAERELLRMATAGKFSSLSGQELSALLSSLESMGISSGLAGDVSSRTTLYNGSPLEGFPYLDVSTPPSLSNRHSPVATPRPVSQGEAMAEARANPGFQHPSGLARQISSSNLQGLGVSTMARDASGPLNQTPSRSLWIGSLRATVTGQELMHVFAQYGAIESLRLLPDRECGFVNFVEIEDAIRAREDILTRLNGKLDGLSNSVGGVVRIGYGKVEHGHGQANVLGQSSILPTTAVNRAPHVLAASTGRQVEEDGTLMQSAGMSDGAPPTRALWVGSIPATVTSATLMSIFQPFGAVESARVLTHKNCGFINFERVEDAVRARKMLNGRDVLGSEVGAMRIGFAKVPTRGMETASLAGNDVGIHGDAGSSSDSKSRPLEDTLVRGGMGIENSRSNLAISLLNGQQQQQQQQQALRQPIGAFDNQVQVGASQKSNLSAQLGRSTGLSSSSSIVPASDKGGVPLPAHMAPRADVNDWQLLMRELSQDDADADADVASMTRFQPMQTYYTTVPLVSEISSGRRFETAKLREIRRGIESGQFSRQQCDQLVLEYLDSIVDLASDYIGNTLVQKFFETCSERIKTEMLQRLAPHLAMIGCHKNGTWAAQKILDCTDTTEHVKLIAQHLRPYIPGLLLDSFGNYVVQCCLRFQPHNDFVFDAMVDRCWEIAQGRFGARSMRACLENNNVSQRQRKRVAIAVILNSVPLATSPNGSILLTWLLETSGLSRSYRLLAPRFSPHLAHLCTHKLASNTVLRIVTQKAEPTASQLILSALFDNEDAQDPMLEDIVADQVHGSQFVTKVLASPTLSDVLRETYAAKVRALLIKNDLVGVPAYRRLCEDLDLLLPMKDATHGLGQAGPTSMNDVVAPPNLPLYPNNAGLPNIPTHDHLPPFPAGLSQAQNSRPIPGPGWRTQ